MDIKKKFITAKEQIKNHLPDIIAVGCTVATVVIAISVKRDAEELIEQKKEFAKLVDDFVEHEEAFLRFVGNGPDYIAVDDKLAKQIENGETFDHDLAGGTRILLTRAEPKNI